MIGLRIGPAAVGATGAALGTGVDQLGGGGRQIIAIVGQSNAVGFADIDNATLKAIYEVAFPAVQLKEQQGTNANPPVWTVYPTRAVQPKPESAGLNMGAELSLARYVDARRPSTWALAKIGIGDTSLADYWRNGTPYPTVPPYLFDQMITFLRAAEGELGGRIAAFVWVQGEKDATDAADAAAYEANLTQFIADIRVYWPGLPFIFNRLHTSNPGANKATVRTAQTNVDSAVSGTSLIDVDALPLQGDNLHFTADGYISLGNLFGKAILGALNVNTLLAGFSTSTNALQVTVTDTSTDEDGSVAAWRYDWGDGSAASTTQNPVHTYALDGSYTITQTVTDNSGFRAVATRQVNVATPTWTIDATSGKATPATESEWIDFIAANALAFDPPDHIWLFQESSGNLADDVGGKTLTVAGSPLYRQTVTGWMRKAITASGLASNQTANNIGMVNANASSILLLIYAEIVQPAATHTRVFHGASSGNDFQGLAASPNMRLRTSGAIGSGALSHTGQVRPYVLRWDRSGAGANVLYSDIEKLSITFTAFSGAELRFTFGVAADVTANTKVLYAVSWEGVAAERTEAQIKALLQAAQWSVSGF